MLRYAILIIGLEQTSDNVRVIPICPYFGFGHVFEKIIPWPEHIVFDTVFVHARVSRCDMVRTKNRAETMPFTRCLSSSFVGFYMAMLPCRLRVAS